MSVFCSRCETLREAPRRADVPSHLQRVEPASDRSRPLRYLCLACGSTWAWTFGEGWGVLDLAPSHRPTRGAMHGASRDRPAPTPLV